MHKAKSIYFLLIWKKKKNEMAQSRKWPKAGHLPLIVIGSFSTYTIWLITVEWLSLISATTASAFHYIIDL